MILRRIAPRFFHGFSDASVRSFAAMSSEHDETEHKLSTQKFSKPGSLNVIPEEDLHLQKFSDEFSLGEIESLEESGGNVQRSYDHIAPILGASFNLARFVPRSKTLQEFVKLGVQLFQWETNTKLCESILMLDFERDIKPYIRFLTDKNVSPNDLGNIFTKNPEILLEDMENLQIRMNYLTSMKFTPEMIAQIITRFPMFLSLSTVEVDKQLGFYQKEFGLAGDEVRDIITRIPKFLQLNRFRFTHCQFQMKEIFGFTKEDVKKIFLAQPKIWFEDDHQLEKRFYLVHNLIGLSQDLIIRFPQCLLCRDWKMKERHLYLLMLGRAQYDPKKVHYVSLKALVTGTDSEFCEKVAKTSVVKFNDFLLTL